MDKFQELARKKEEEYSEIINNINILNDKYNSELSYLRAELLKIQGEYRLLKELASKE